MVSSKLILSYIHRMIAWNIETIIYWKVEEKRISSDGDVDACVSDIDSDSSKGWEKRKCNQERGERGERVQIGWINMTVKFSKLI